MVPEAPEEEQGQAAKPVQKPSPRHHRRCRRRGGRGRTRAASAGPTMPVTGASAVRGVSQQGVVLLR